MGTGDCSTLPHVLLGRRERRESDRVIEFASPEARRKRCSLAWSATSPTGGTSCTSSRSSLELVRPTRSHPGGPAAAGYASRRWCRLCSAANRSLKAAIRARARQRRTRTSQMTAPRAMNAAVIGLPTRSQGEAAFLRRQRAQVRSGEACGKTAAGLGDSCAHPPQEQGRPGDPTLANLTPVELAEKIENRSLRPRVAPTGDAAQTVRVLPAL